MNVIPFSFSSPNLPRLKAKQLSKTFPFLTLATSQEATARALGYSSWYECSRRGTSNPPSKTDQDAGMAVRVSRYYHQAGVLMGIGIPPLDADLWVRAWGLTGTPTLAPKRANPLFYEWNIALEKLERGEVDEAWMEEHFEESWISKYPSIAWPRRICPGVILGPCGKYPHYALDPALYAKLPHYLRPLSGTYHLEDDVDCLSLGVPSFPKRESHDSSVLGRNPIHYEWHYGRAHPDEDSLIVPRLVEAALARPGDLMVISTRGMPTPERTSSRERDWVACLYGRDFARFLLSKGGIDLEKVVWFRDVEFPFMDFGFGDWLAGFGRFPGAKLLPVFERAKEMAPSQPVYSYPFMEGPMRSEEYGAGYEAICLLPLDEDYKDIDDDDDDEDPDGPDSGGPPTGPDGAELDGHRTNLELALVR